jgi:hypothetical protein
MPNAILVIDGEKTIKDKVSLWMDKKLYKLVLTGLFPASSEAKNIEIDRACWLSLFALREEFERMGFSVSIATEKGSVFDLINVVHSIEADILFLPKLKFLTLAIDEFDDFLTQLPCSLILY